MAGDRTRERPIRTLLILGASGDLTGRQLLPGLATLLEERGADGLVLLGAGRTDWDDDRWRELIVQSFAATRAGRATAEEVARGAVYRRADVTNAKELAPLLELGERAIAIYFALPPAVTWDACCALGEIGVPAGTQLVLEKPFGTDLASARKLNQLLVQLVPEDHIHRVDHFLGRATVLNILGVRFANRMLEPVLNNTHVAGVDIICDESLALERRAGYYDHAGALVDMIQSHLLQVLALVAMDPPATLEAQDVRDCKGQVLRATSIWNDDPIGSSRRARYTAGELDGRSLPSYVDEEGVDPARATETLAAIALAVETWRWASVPFRLRSGKAIGAPRQEVVITFKDPPRLPTGFTGYKQSDRVRLGLGARQLSLDLNINGEGDPFTIEASTLQGEYAAGDLLEYGQVLRGVLDGDPPLSVRGSAAVESWRIVDPVLVAWHEKQVPLEEYAAGSAGPDGWWV